MLEVVQPGPLTTIQDLGRPGYQQYGVPVSGAMDRFAFFIANALVGNNPTDASLEITMHGLAVKALASTSISIAGADMGVTLNGEQVANWCSINLSSGDMLQFHEAQEGARAYLAVAGWVDCPIVLGSRSTYLRGGFGGIQGRQLTEGDIIRGAGSVRSELQLSRDDVPCYGERITVRVVLGPQDDYFTDDGISTLLSSEYSITSASDRMGYRLSGPLVQHVSSTEIISDGISWGAIQVPGDRLPIVMMVDRQTTGGYPKIATVISADLPLLAQSKPGDQIMFKQVDINQAHTISLDFQKRMSEIAARLEAREKMWSDLERIIRLQGSIR